jgi:hypothetical protein
LGEGELDAEEVHCPFICYGEAGRGLRGGGVGAEMEGVTWGDVVDVEGEKRENEGRRTRGKVV